jgi:DNA replicative helicase MCM subunit Mcm2 (Cdc46/Mcm family)
MSLHTIYCSGVVTKRDLKSLMKLSKAVAKAENVALSKEELEQVAKVEALSDLADE